MIYIVCTCRNAELWIERCLGSVLDQSYSDFKCYLYIDSSQDKTAEIAKKCINNDARFTCIESLKRNYAALSRWEVLTKIKDENAKDIVVLLDGDDWLNGKDALKKLVAYYSDNKIVLTHGNYITDSGELCHWSCDYSVEEKRLNMFRYSPWIATHLRTFKVGLIQYLFNDLFIDDKGKFFKTATDFALFLPLLELAGTYSLFIPEPLYVYNERDGIALGTTRILEQLKNEAQIRDRTPLNPLPETIINNLI